MIIAGRYEATGGAAWGGFSEVHRFRDNHLNRDVMLKRVPNPKNLPRLLDEQKALLSLRSKHVVELLDVVEYNIDFERETGLIIEFIEGADLEEGSFTFGPDYLTVLWQISAGLRDIHLAGVIHRDIKPPNLRRDASSIVKIIDFGLSRQVGIDDTTRSVIGSFGYLAPELGGTGIKQLTPAADVFAFGMTALALIKPVAQQGRLSPRLVAGILSGASVEIVAMVSRCIEADPKNRPDMGEIEAVLSAELLVGRHRAWLNRDGAVTEINASSPNASIRTNVGSLDIRYDGRAFVVTAVSGHVSINNYPLTVGQRLYASGVIGLGNATVGRGFVTFDISNPEVMA